MNIDILSKEEISILSKLIKGASNIITLCHKNPDGDALGATLAWNEFLLSRHKSANIIVPDAWPDFLQWLPNIETIIRYDKHAEYAENLLNNADLIFCLDFNDSSRLFNMQCSFENSEAKRVIIDHHLHPQLAPELLLSFPHLSSTSEIIFRIVWQFGLYDKMSKHFAISIYTGMMTDTGSFTFSSSYPEIYFIISQLLAKNIDKDKIYHKVYNNYSVWCMRMRGYILYQKMNIIPDAHAAYFVLSRDDMSRFHYIKGDAEGLVNEPLKIRNMRLSISLREDTELDNKIWVSLRTNNPYHCNQIANQFFYGGGHPNASGGCLNCKVDEAIDITKAAILKFQEIYN